MRLKIKIKLASDMIGSSPLAIKEVFNTFANSLPCVYLFQIGTMKSLRKTMKIDKKYDDSDYDELRLFIELFLKNVYRIYSSKFYKYS